MSRGGAGVRIYSQAPGSIPQGPSLALPTSAVSPVSLTSLAASWVSSLSWLLSWTQCQQQPESPTACPDVGSAHQILTPTSSKG